LTLLHSGNSLLGVGDQGLSINIGADLLEYVEQKFLKQFGKDNESVQLASWFKGLQQTALKQTSEVHCVGMKAPLAFDKIYQPTRLLVGPEPGEVPSESYSWGDRVSRSILRGRAFNEKSITVSATEQEGCHLLDVFYSSRFGGRCWLDGRFR
jgi:hypothetical protein